MESNRAMTVREHTEYLQGTLQSHSNLVEFAENDLETPESYAEAVI